MDNAQRGYARQRNRTGTAKAVVAPVRRRSVSSCAPAIGAVTAVLLLTGCHYNPYGAGYYGPYAPTPSYGPTYAPGSMPPGNYMAPGPTYVPQNMSPTPLPGNPNSPTPLNGSPPQSLPNWRPDTSTTPNAPLDDAPPFRPNPGATNNNLVPDPLEPDFSPNPPAAAAAFPRANPIGTAPGGLASTPVSTAAADDPFEEPRRVTQLPTDADPFAMDATAAPAAGKTDPYGYDGKQYSWLRGIVDFDDQTQTWSIIYDLTPDPGDKFGGSLVFTPHASLASLRPGALVLAKGQVDPGKRDNTGKLLYELQQIIPLAPPSGIQ